jgi:hypothetical protein
MSDPDDDGVGPLSQPTAVKVADLQDINNIYYTPEPFSPPIHVSVERRKVDKVLEIMEDTAHRLRALDGIDVTFAVHADHRGRVEGELTIREPIWRKEARA